jgi:hypothetical protein
MVCDQRMQGEVLIDGESFLKSGKLCIALMLPKLSMGE